MKSYENSISELQTKNQHGMDKSCDGYDAVVVEREDVNACPYLPVAFLASPSGIEVPCSVMLHQLVKLMSILTVLQRVCFSERLQLDQAIS